MTGVQYVCARVSAVRVERCKRRTDMHMSVVAHKQVLDDRGAAGKGCEEEGAVGQRLAAWQPYFPTDALDRLHHTLVYSHCSTRRA